ncbi:hypothetical protein Syun_015256 [Stephania yunnanensis]|uniref:BHLH domain-containing protein n=1 Tax=Stephania yunnanensis TaxID=152371 RepID=A0AAP0PCN1_9MAGN
MCPSIHSSLFITTSLKYIYTCLSLYLFFFISLVFNSIMSEIDHQGNDFLWENQACWPFSSSDNSAGDRQPDDLKFAEAKKGLDLSSNSPTPTPTPTPTPRTVVPSSTVSSKRGRNHGSKSGGLKGEKKDDKEGCGGGGSGGGESDHEIHIWTERERRKKMRNMFSNLHALLPQLPPKADKSTIVDEAVNYIKTLQHTLQKLQKQKLEMLRGAATTTTTTTMQYEPSMLAGLQTAPLTINTTISTTTSTSRESFMADRVSSRDHSTDVISATNMNTTLMTSSASPSIPPAVVPSPACLRSWSSPNVVLNVSGNDAQINICAPKKPGLLDAVLFVLEKHQIEVVTAHISSDYYRSMYMIHANANRTWDQFQGALLVEEVYKLAVDEILCWISSCS